MTSPAEPGKCFLNMFEVLSKSDYDEHRHGSKGA
jgi:hypothetical protein